eukprot:g78910.t1
MWRQQVVEFNRGGIREEVETVIQTTTVPNHKRAIQVLLCEGCARGLQIPSMLLRCGRLSLLRRPLQTCASSIPSLSIGARFSSEGKEEEDEDFESAIEEEVKAKPCPKFPKVDYGKPKVDLGIRSGMFKDSLLHLGLEKQSKSKKGDEPDLQTIWENVMITDEEISREAIERRGKMLEELREKMEFDESIKKAREEDPLLNNIEPFSIAGIPIPKGKFQEVAANLTEEQRKRALEEYMRAIDAGPEADDEAVVEEEVKRIMAEENDQSDKPTEITYKQPEYPLQHQDKWIPRIYPFVMEIETLVVRKEEEDFFMREDQDRIEYKSKLTVEISELETVMPPLQIEIFKELCGPRYKPGAKSISFVSRTLPSMWGNENRCFQWMDALLWESKQLLDQFEKDGLESHDQLWAAEHYRATVPKSHARFNPFAQVPDLAKELEKADISDTSDSGIKAEASR